MGQTVGGATKVGLALPGGSPLITASPDTLFSSSPTFVKGGSGIAVAPGASVADGLKYGGKASIPLTGGRSALVNVAGRITPAALAGGAKNLLGGPVGVAVLAGGVVLPHLLAWMTDAGLSIQNGNITQGDPNACTVAPCYEYYDFNFNGGMVTQSCSATAALLDAAYPIGGGQTRICVGSPVQNLACASGNMSICNNISYSVRTVAPSTGTSTATLDQVETKLQTVAAPPGVVPELLDKGIAIPVESPTVTGPSSTAGPQSQTNQPDGKVVTQTTTHNHTYQGDTVTTTITNTTNVYNPTTNTTETTTEEKEPEDERQCKDGDQSAGCAELDTPDGQIPKAQRQLTYDSTNLFGMGSCPADVMVSIGGQQHAAIDMSGTVCPMVATYVRPLVIALATFMALVILVPGGKPE